MALQIKITPYEKSFQLLIDRNLSPEARSERIAAFAKREIDAAEAINKAALGTVPPETVTVDGRRGAALDSVNPDHGIIVAEWKLIGELLQWIMDTLKARSPVQSGRYRDSHTLYADGAEADTADVEATEYIFLNLQPYARKIEIGKTKAGRDFVIAVPNRIYERTAADAKARFGNLAKISFTYQSAVGGRIAKHHGSDDRVPAIRVTIQ